MIQCFFKIISVYCWPMKKNIYAWNLQKKMEYFPKGFIIAFSRWIITIRTSTRHNLFLFKKIPNVFEISTYIYLSVLNCFWMPSWLFHSIINHVQWILELNVCFLIHNYEWIVLTVMFCNPSLPPSVMSDCCNLDFFSWNFVDAFAIFIWT